MLSSPCSFSSDAILKLEEAKQILMETERLSTGVLPGLRKEQADLETTIRKTRNEAEDLENRLVELREKKQMCEVQIQVAETEALRAEDQLLALRAERQKLEENIENNRREAEALRTVLLDLSEQKQEAFREAEAQKISLQKLREEARVLQLEVQEAKATSQSLCSGIANEQKDYERARRELEALHGEVLALRDEKQTLQTQIQANRQALACALANQGIQSIERDDTYQTQTNPFDMDNEESHYNDDVWSPPDQEPDFIMDDDSQQAMTIATTVTPRFSSAGTEKESPWSLTDTSLFSPFSGGSGRKRRASRVYNSPKKWRRMIRNHRLQSILVGRGASM